MISWLSARFGERTAKAAMFAIIFIFAVLLLVFAQRCSPKDRTAQEQAAQTTRSGEATANAAKDAIRTIGSRNNDERQTDARTAQTIKEINDAQNDDDIRRTVLNGVCGQAAHRHDPSCPVR